MNFGFLDNTFSKMVEVRQTFPAPKVEDVPGKVRSELARVGLPARIKPGMTVALTAGSRGVTNIALILRTIAEELKRMGAKPFVVPTMGSHGGAFAEGQVEILSTLGVTEDYLGVPIRASMEVVQVGTTSTDIPVYVDQHAAGADGIIVVGRVKPHTDFKGEIESGLHKMMVIGLGKHRGALTAHRHALRRSFRAVLPEIGGVVLQKCNILCGVATIENVYDETADLVAVKPEEFEAVEKTLQVRSKELIARLPFDEIDVLIVDQMGKNISGTGMDTNVLGRVKFPGEPDLPTPRINRIVVRDLTPQTHGNAIGVGLADFTTRRLVDKINYEATYINCLTGQGPERGMLPMICDDERQAIACAMFTCGAFAPESTRVVHIQDTLHLETMYVSECLVPAAKGNPGLRVGSEAFDLEFDSDGTLVSRFGVPALH
ncbi:MAG: nickel-dependent lactate racemase [Bacteroidetes bacterium]|nr:nickel-dependent lactate racemase [Bacteroidota bacterium]MCL5026135.1 nickel-dependent lactate racemase [Chloroflexota bacterium]